jgi:hypothetical protein
MRNKLILDIGTKFGSWTIISNETLKKNNLTHWKCKCSCGQEKYVPLNNLMNGKSKQCVKCSRKIQSEKNKKGIGLITGTKWLRIKNKYKNENLNIENAFNDLIKQNYKCVLSGKNLVGNNVLNGDYIKYENEYYWIHTTVKKIFKTINFIEIIDISKTINKWQKNN